MAKKRNKFRTYLKSKKSSKKTFKMIQSNFELLKKSTTN
jgi:hypothetical protein